MEDREPPHADFWQELKTRKVWRVTAAYGVGTFAALQVADLLIPYLALPDWTVRLVILSAAIGFPVAVVLAWAFDVTPEGVESTDPGPGRRVRPVILGATATVVAVAGGWFVWPRADSGLPPVTSALEANRVAIPAFANQTGDATVDALGELASDWISDGLMDVPELSVVDGQVARNAFAAATTTSPLEHLARGTRSGILVTGSYFRSGDSVAWSAQILRGDDLELLYSIGPHAAPVSSPTAALEPLAGEIAGRLAQHMEWGNAEVIRLYRPAPSYEAFAELRRGDEEFAVARWREALPHYQRAAELAPSWFAAYRGQMGVHLNLGGLSAIDSLVQLTSALPDLTRVERLTIERFEHRVQGNVAGDHETLLELSRINPLHWLYQLGYTANYLNRPEAAIRYFSQIDEVLEAYTPWQFWWIQHANALHVLGRHAEALEVLEQGMRHHPDARVLYRSRVAELAALGRFEEAVDEAVAIGDLPLAGSSMGSVFRRAGQEIFVHGGPSRLAADMLRRSVADYEARSAAGSAYLESLNWLGLFERPALETASDLVSSWLEDDPYDPISIGWYGATRARLGDADSARRALGRLAVNAAVAEPRRASFRGADDLAAARIYAALGEHDQAVQSLSASFSEGLNFGPWIHVDPYLHTLNGVPGFDELVRPSG
jgi:tetratricopeptide (TPR) repeat protein